MARAAATPRHVSSAEPEESPPMARARAFTVEQLLVVRATG